MKRTVIVLVHATAQRAMDAIALVGASLAATEPYDAKRSYTPAELEPHDALCDRFVRAVETTLKFLRTVELLEYAEQSDTVRDLLNRAAKLDLISSPELWLCMRDARNRIVHDYLPEDLAVLHHDLHGIFGAELLRLRRRIRSYIAGQKRPARSAAARGRSAPKRRCK